MRKTKMPMLSKSRFIAGLQCPLRLWYQCYNRELASEVTPGQQAIFDAGHQAGRLATELYPGGVLIDEDYLHHREAEHSTARALTDRNVKVLFEAAFTLTDRVKAGAVLEIPFPVAASSSAACGFFCRSTPLSSLALPFMVAII